MHHRWKYDQSGSVDFWESYGFRGVPSSDEIEHVVFVLAGTIVVIVAAMQGTGHLTTSPPFVLKTPPIPQDVCSSSSPSFTCAYGLTNIAACHSGMCYGTGGPGQCGGSFSNEAWLLVLSNCAQPAWWPWFLCALVGVWTLVKLPPAALRLLTYDPNDPANLQLAKKPYPTRTVQSAVITHQLLLLVAFTCMAAGYVAPYWILSSFALAVAGVVRRLGTWGFVASRLARFVFLAVFSFVPLLTIISVILALFWGFSPAETNQVLVVYALVNTSCVIVGSVFAASSALTKRHSKYFWASFVVSAATLGVVAASFVLLLPLTWIVWPLYLLFTNWNVIRLGQVESLMRRETNAVPYAVVAGTSTSASDKSSPGKTR